MKIHNLRLGHATNSSSSHSIVIAPSNYADMPHTKNGSEYGDYNYGWEEFLLADPDSKTNYLAAQLYGSLTGRDGISNDLAGAVIRDWLKVDLTDADVGIDHQSALTFTSNSLTEKFVKGLVGFFRDDRVLIYGGNDNGGQMDIPDEFGEIKFLSAITDTTGKLRLKNDGKYWIFYNVLTGSKLRFSFEVDDIDADEYTKATTPELVDLKITDYCPYGCEFCYQASTKEGIHANLTEIGRILWNLKDIDVFEVAIGGGEPTMHPEFAKILKRCYDYDVRPNFTTYSRKWLKDKEIVEAVKEYVGGIGVSLHTEKDLKLLGDIAKVVNGDRDDFGGYWRSNSVSIMGQHVLGAHPLDETIQLISEVWKMGTPVLLLGYKNVGFGSEFKPHDMTGIELALKLLLEEPEFHHQVSLSVDTAVLDQFPDLCKTLQITDILTSSPEGKFSMYIDAVNGRMAKSSYVTEDEYIDLEDKHHRLSQTRIIDAFSRW